MLTSTQNNASVIPRKILSYMAAEQEIICTEVNRGLLEVFTPQKIKNLFSIAGSEYDHGTFQVTQQRRRDLFCPRQCSLIQQCLINYPDYIIVGRGEVMDGELGKIWNEAICLLLVSKELR